MNTTLPAVRLAGHASIDTEDLVRSVGFYRALFGVEPALERPGYVRFWPPDLGFVLGLNETRPRAHGNGAVRHLGVLFPDAAALASARRRLAEAGFVTRGEENVTCCHAWLDQFWATDPSGVSWELFLAHEAVVDPDAHALAGPVAAAAETAAETGDCCATDCCS